nr:uncharacterized protein LOC109154352 isoform X2 [Ipomoea batatas]
MQPGRGSRDTTVIPAYPTPRVIGEDENQYAENETVEEENDSGEEENGSGEEETDSVEVELDQFKGSDYGDDADFVKYTDQEVEYGGQGNLEVESENVNQRPTHTGVNLNDEEAGIDLDLGEGESVRPNPPPSDLPNPLWLAPHGEVPAAVHGEVPAVAVPAPVVVPLAPVVPAPLVVPLPPVVPAAIVVPVAPTSDEVAHEEIPPFPVGDEDSQLPTIETQVDHLLSVGDSVHKVIDDLNSQVTDVGLHGIESHNTVGEGMMTTSHGVKISFGQPAKRRKTTSHARKGKEVVDSAPPTKPKKQKHLGITKSWTARARKYMTRSSTMFRSKGCNTEKDPITIE